MSEREQQSKSGDAADEAEMRRALVSYETRLTEIAALALDVRHDINNALTGLLGQTQLLLREDVGDAARRRLIIIEELGTRIRDKVAELHAAEHIPSERPRDEKSEKNAPPRH